MLQQTQHGVKVNFVATKSAIVAAKVEENYKKLMMRHINLCSDKVRKTR